jgi:hypothetical protein
MHDQRSSSSDTRYYPVVELTLSRMREFLREPEAVFWVFAFPVLMALALGVAFRSQKPQEVVAGVVTERVVEILEVVEVGEHDGIGLGIHTGADRALEAAPVRESREGIRRGLEL